MKTFAIKLLWLLTLLLLVSACKTTDATLPPTPSAIAVAAVAIPPDHVGRTTCFVCHQTGVGGAPKFPSGHESSADNVTFCQECHQALGDATTLTAVPTSNSQSPPPPSTVPSTAVPSISTTSDTRVGGPPTIPHALDAAHTDCLMCHQTGVAGAIKIPDDHAGRTDAMCTLSGCHAAS